MKRISVILFICLVFLGLPATANEAETKETSTPSWKCTLCKISQSKDYSLVIPVNTWHNRQMYDQKKTDSYNERPWGIGLSKDYIDPKGNRHSLFLMEFQDSHNHVEPFAGYIYNILWALDKKKDFRVSVGGILGITARSEYHYIPFPAPLPVVGFEYKRLILESTYIPGSRNNGNVLFTWLRWKL